MNPNDTDILHAIAVDCSFKYGRFDEGLSLLSRAIAIDPRNPRYDLLIAEIYRNKGMADKCQDALIAAERKNPTPEILSEIERMKSMPLHTVADDCGHAPIPIPKSCKQCKAKSLCNHWPEPQDQRVAEDGHCQSYNRINEDIYEDSSVQEIESSLERGMMDNWRYAVGKRNVNLVIWGKPFETPWSKEIARPWNDSTSSSGARSEWVLTFCPSIMLNLHDASGIRQREKELTVRTCRKIRILRFANDRQMEMMFDTHFMLLGVEEFEYILHRGVVLMSHITMNNGVVDEQVIPIDANTPALRIFSRCG